MSTATHISEEQYLHSSFEPDAEYVDGEVRERRMGTYDHGDWQQAIQRWFAEHAKLWNVRSIPELRMRVRPRRYRIPDVTVVDRANAKEQVVTVAPLAVFEVLSPDDTVQEMYEKLDDYAAMGIPQIWIVDPKTGSFKQYSDACLRPASRFEMPTRGIQFDVREIAGLLQD
ncbi:MAG TPA: Uma2 family endonuclease [Terracidiphilus sp.]|jgi:Uma2 family endonuclease